MGKGLEKLKLKECLHSDFAHACSERLPPQPPLGARRHPLPARQGRQGRSTDCTTVMMAWKDAGLYLKVGGGKNQDAKSLTPRLYARGRGHR